VEPSALTRRPAVATALLLAVAAGPPLAGQQAPATAASPQVFTASVYTGLHAPLVEALLYNPPVPQVEWKVPDKPGSTVRKVEPVLVLYARGLADGTTTLKYGIDAGTTTLTSRTADVNVEHGGFELAVTLDATYPKATHVTWECTAAGRAAVKGRVELRWSRFRGQLEYLDGGWRSSYIEMWPNGFRAPGSFYVPVGDDGRFDALVPARVYSVMNVNGAGYKYDAMERWAWDYDLTRDRLDEFTIGRTEIYAMRAFDLNAPLSTIFVMFRPTALSRVLRFDADGDGRISDAETKAMLAALKVSATAIGPELEAADVKVWLNGNEEPIVRFDRIPEYDGDFWQVQYVLQIFPKVRPPRGAWHEIKVEVRSKEQAHGRDVIDFGQGSVGFQRY
jgi:hypothetical protein